MGIRLRTALLGALVGAIAVAGFAGPVGGLSASADQQLAKAGALTLADFPQGWAQKARDSSSDTQVQKAAEKLPSCKQFAAFGKANSANPKANSPDFDLGGASVSNTVSLYASEAKAVAAMKTFGASALPICLEKLFRAEFAAEFKKDPKTAKQIDSVAVSISRTRGVDVGDQAIAYEGPVTVSLKDGTSVKLGLGFIAVRVGRAVSGFSYSADTDISAALQPALLGSIGRLQTALSTA